MWLFLKEKKIFRKNEKTSRFKIEKTSLKKFKNFFSDHKIKKLLETSLKKLL